MKIFKHKIFAHRKIIFIFLLAIFLPSLIAGGEPRELYTWEIDGPYLWHTWTPDGKYILFTMINSKIDDPKWELCRIPIEGGEIEKLGLKMSLFFNLSVHPDGRQIAFSSSGPTQRTSEIWVMENFLPEIKAEQ